MIKITYSVSHTVEVPDEYYPDNAKDLTQVITIEQGNAEGALADMISNGDVDVKILVDRV